MGFSRTGDYFGLGCIAGMVVLQALDLHWGWGLALALVGGWLLNEKSRESYEAEIAREQHRRDNGLFPYDRKSR